MTKKIPLIPGILLLVAGAVFLSKGYPDTSFIAFGSSLVWFIAAWIQKKVHLY